MPESGFSSCAGGCFAKLLLFLYCRTGEKRMNSTIELFAYTLFIAGVVGIIFAISLRWFMLKDSKKK
jgi:hypothetical protein